jgi:hypothetical protein
MTAQIVLTGTRRVKYGRRVDATPGAGTVVISLARTWIMQRLIARSTKETAEVRKCFAAAGTLSPDARTTWKSICSVWRMERCGFSFCACCFDYHLTHGNDVRNRPAGDGFAYSVESRVVILRSPASSRAVELCYVLLRKSCLDPHKHWGCFCKSIGSAPNARYAGLYSSNRSLNVRLTKTRGTGRNRGFMGFLGSSACTILAQFREVQYRFVPCCAPSLRAIYRNC